MASRVSPATVSRLLPYQPKLFYAISIVPPSRSRQLPFAAPAPLIGPPGGSIGDGLGQVFGGEDVGRQKARFLKWCDVDSHAVVEVGVVAALLGEERGKVGWGRLDPIGYDLPGAEGAPTCT